MGHTLVFANGSVQDPGREGATPSRFIPLFIRLIVESDEIIEEKARERERELIFLSLLVTGVSLTIVFELKCEDLKFASCYVEGMILIYLFSFAG